MKRDFGKKSRIYYEILRYIMEGCDFIMNWDRHFNDFNERLGYITIGWDFIMKGEDFMITSQDFYNERLRFY